MLAYRIYRRNIEQGYQYISYRIAREFHQPEENIGYHQRNGNGAADLLEHKYQEVSVSAVDDNGTHEDKERNACSVIEERFILDDRAYIL